MREGASVPSRIGGTSVPAPFVAEFSIPAHGTVRGAAAVFTEKLRRFLISMSTCGAGLFGGPPLSFVHLRGAQSFCRRGANMFVLSTTSTDEGGGMLPCT